MDELIYDHIDGEVLSHQFSEGRSLHRLVVCCTPPQHLGKWTPIEKLAWCDGYYADAVKGPAFSTISGVPIG